MLEEFSLEGKVAVITGASRSLGRGIAIAMGRGGAKVVLCGRWAEGLERVKGEVESAGADAVSQICDVSDPAQVDDLIAAAKSAFGQIDVMVANAGVFQDWVSSEDVSLEEWDRVIGVDLRGVWLCCSAAGRAMIEAGNGGSLIAISSIAGQAALPKLVSYNAAKFGVVGLMKTLAVDWAPHGIRANALTPGFIERDDEFLQDIPEMVQFVTTRTLLGRWGKPHELGAAAVFLASDAASFITGTTLAVDGGWLAQ
jgi:NAD(P)-dependent dehydrogenase (short-subunit alcohol dehydrogenase family)